MKTRRILWHRVAILAITPVLIASAGVSAMRKNLCKSEEMFEKSNILFDNANQTEEISFIEDLPEYESLGEFKVTYFCGGACCNGEKYAGWSASNKRLEVGMCAADPSIPFGTELYLSGGVNGLMECYTVEDRGSAIKGNHIDIYVPDHKTAQQLGVVYTEVFVKK